MIDLFELDNYSIYTINTKLDNFYSVVSILSNSNIHCFDEMKFAFFANLNCKNAWSLKNSDCVAFEKTLTKANVSFGKINFKEQYIKYLEKYLNAKDLDKLYKSFNKLCEFQVDELPNYRHRLLEHNIKGKNFSPKDSIILYVRSDENTNHYEPHVHANVRGKSLDFCSIAIVSKEVLAKDKYADDGTIKKCIDKLQEVTEEAKIKWDSCSKSTITFAKDESGKLTDEFVKRDQL